MVELIDLIRNGTLSVDNRRIRFVDGFVYSSNLNDEEILNNITFLSCRCNQLTFLHEMPNLTYLDCSYNQLTSLSNGPNLIYLYCDSNRLTSLPNMPNLITLYCNSNQLTSLPTNGSNIPNLIDLSCSNNQLTTLPNMPNLTYLKCHDNQLTSNNIDCWKTIWHNQSKLSALMSSQTSYLGIPNLNRDLQHLIMELLSH